MARNQPDWRGLVKPGFRTGCVEDPAPTKILGLGEAGRAMKAA